MKHLSKSFDLPDGRSGAINAYMWPEGKSPWVHDAAVYVVIDGLAVTFRTFFGPFSTEHARSAFFEECAAREVRA